jgi:hypothetical protein
MPAAPPIHIDIPVSLTSRPGSDGKKCLLAADHKRAGELLKSNMVVCYKKDEQVRLGHRE